MTQYNILERPIGHVLAVGKSHGVPTSYVEEKGYCASQYLDFL